MDYMELLDRSVQYMELMDSTDIMDRISKRYGL